MTQTDPAPATSRPWPQAAGAAFCGLTLGAGAVAIIGLITGTGLLAGESAESKALKVLRGDQRAVTILVADLAEADRVAELRRVGQQAEEYEARARARDASLAVIDDEKVKPVAVRAHNANVRVLAGIAELANVDTKHLDAWGDGERQVVSALSEIDAVALPVAGWDEEQPLRFSSQPVEEATQHASAYLTTAARRLARYEKRMAKFRKRNRARLRAAVDYRATVNAQMAAYAETRKELQGYIDDTKEFDDRIAAFRRTLQDARSKRQAIRGTLASLNVPERMADENQALVAVLDKAIAGTDAGIDLADATQDLRDEGSPESGFTLPEYERFKQISDEITQERNAAVGAWMTEMVKYIRRLRFPPGAPDRPTI